MPRPLLVIGTWGKINRVQRGPKLWVAYARYRDHDGQTRQAERTGGTAQKAEDALKEALRDRLRLDSEDITRESRIVDVAAVWFEEQIEGRKAENTERWYRHAIDNIIAPGIGGVRLTEVTVSRMDRFLKAVAASRGPGAAKTTKTVLAGVFALAARHGALTSNPLRDVAPIKRGPAKDVEVLDLQQLLALRQRMHADTLARNRDLPEPIDFMLATGARIGEALAVRWFDLDLDSVPATVVIRATVVAGKVQEKPKSPTSRRRLKLPAWEADSLRARRAVAPPNDLQLVFASERGTVRDPNNLRRQWRQLRETLGLDWVTPHTFRKSVATLADDPALAQQQLGHADQHTTTAHYIPRTHEGPDLTSVLDQLGNPAETQRKQRAGERRTVTDAGGRRRNSA